MSTNPQSTYASSLEREIITLQQLIESITTKQLKSDAELEVEEEQLNHHIYRVYLLMAEVASEHPVPVPHKNPVHKDPWSSLPQEPRPCAICG